MFIHQSTVEDNAIMLIYKRNACNS